MIPVEMQPEPSGFPERVRSPGKRFLSQIAKPTPEQWRGKDYWRRVLPDMRKAYKGVCSYSASWIPHSTGNHSIDHFIPKSRQPELAYEWDNYRYSSLRFNARKGTHSVVDPFKLLPNSFVLDFRSFFIKPNPKLSPKEQKTLQETIKCLKLNDDEDLVVERQACCSYYFKNEISFNHLQQRYPFIAFELERQNMLRNKQEARTPTNA